MGSHEKDKSCFFESKQTGQKNNSSTENPELQGQTKTKAVGQQTEDQSEETNKNLDGTIDNKAQTDQQAESCTKDQETRQEKNLVEDQQLGQNNRAAATPELPHETNTKEGTFSPEILQQQTENQSEETKKPSDDTTDNKAQTDQQAESCTKDQETRQEKKLVEDQQLGQKDRQRSTENPKLQHDAKTKDKISIVILGNEDSLKKAIITNILGKDLAELSKRKILKNTEIYEKEMFVLICTPDLRTPCDDISEFLSKNPHPDMCLFIVERGFSTEKIWQQIDDLNMKTGKPTDEFTVVLPLGYNATDYPFKSLTLEQLLNELDKVIKVKQTTNTRSILNPQLQDQLDKIGKHTYTTVNLVLLGMAGTGKSASGNTILGERHFISKPSSNPVTTECQVAETEINGLHVRVIDTPDIFDDATEPSVRDKHVKRCKQLCGSGPCVYVLVMHVSRFTGGERDIMKKLENIFGKVKEQTVILFTRGEDLQEADMTLEDFLNSCQPGLKEIIENCGNTCVLFENRSSSSDQVVKLMNTVNMMLKKTAKVE